jgi:hypothetical protein
MKSYIYFFLFLFLFAGSTAILSQPVAPENLTAIQGSSYNHPVFVKLSWTGSTTNMIHYNVYRKNGALSDTGSFFRRYSGLRGTIFNDYNVMPGRTYSYYVTAFNIQGESAPSNYAEITLTGPSGNGNITGVVVNDVTLLPLRGANVIFFRTSGFGMSISARTDSNGVFNLNLPADTYYLKTHAFGYLCEFYDNAATLADATPIIVTDGAAININVSLAPVVPPVTFTVTGSVKDSLGNPLMSGVRIYRTFRNAHYMNLLSTRTDSLGNFTLNAREGDTVVVYACPLDRDYYPEFWDNKMTFAEADRIPVTGNVTDINFILQHKPVYQNSLTGVVADTTGIGVESFVSLIRLGPGLFRKQTVSSDSLGSYSFTNIIPGKYILRAHPKEGYLPTFFRYDGVPTLNWNLADSVIVEENSVLTDISFTVLPLPEPGEGIIAGQITSLGKIVEAAYVYAQNPDGEIAAYGISDASGNYLLTGLKPGEFEIVPDKIDFSGQPEVVTVNYTNYIFQNADLTLVPQSITSTGSQKPEVISNYQLYQNYPNPFNPATTIKFSLPEKSQVKISVYNLLGIKVAQLLNEVKDAGTHSVSFDGSNLSSGVYFYKIEAGTFTSTKKLTLLK